MKDICQRKITTSAECSCKTKKKRDLSSTRAKVNFTKKGEHLILSLKEKVRLRSSFIRDIEKGDCYTLPLESIRVGSRNYTKAKSVTREDAQSKEAPRVQVSFEKSMGLRIQMSLVSGRWREANENETSENN